MRNSDKAKVKVISRHLNQLRMCMRVPLKHLVLQEMTHLSITIHIKMKGRFAVSLQNLLCNFGCVIVSFIIGFDISLGVY